MSKNEGHQKIKCNVHECSHNCNADSTCELKEISVCNASNNKCKDPLKDTACLSYDYDKQKDKH